MNAEVRPSHEVPSEVLSVRQLRSSWAGPFDLVMNSSECVCVLGRSGSGKSAMLRLIADLDPGEGVVCLHGTDRRSINGPSWRRQVVYQSAEPAWWKATFADHLGAGDDEPYCRTMASDIGLDPALLAQPLVTLSTGQRQRLALLRTLARRPSVVLLDEPTASLDMEATLRVEALVTQVAGGGCSVLWVTHSEEQAQRVGHRIVRIEPTAMAA